MSELKKTVLRAVMNKKLSKSKPRGRRTFGSFLKNFNSARRGGPGIEFFTTKNAPFYRHGLVLVLECAKTCEPNQYNPQPITITLGGPSSWSRIRDHFIDARIVQPSAAPARKPTTSSSTSHSHLHRNNLKFSSFLRRPVACRFCRSLI